MPSSACSSPASAGATRSAYVVCGSSYGRSGAATSCPAFRRSSGRLPQLEPSCHLPWMRQNVANRRDPNGGMAAPRGLATRGRLSAPDAACAARSIGGSACLKRRGVGLVDHAAFHQLLAEPLDRLRAFPFGGSVELDEAQEQLGILDPPQHALEPSLIELSASPQLAPECVRPVVELDG